MKDGKWKRQSESPKPKSEYKKFFREVTAASLGGGFSQGHTTGATASMPFEPKSLETVSESESSRRFTLLHNRKYPKHESKESEEHTTKKRGTLRLNNDIKAHEKLEHGVRRGALLKSVAHFNKSPEFYLSSSDEEVLAHAETYTKLGKTNLKVGDYDGANNQLKTALRARQHVNPKDLKVAELQEILGDMSVELKKYDDSLKYYNGALTTLRQQTGYNRVKADDTIFMILVKKGNVLLECGNKEEALECFVEALPGTTELYLVMDRDVRTEVVIKMGFLYYELNDYDNAMPLLSEALTKQCDGDDFASVAYITGCMYESMKKFDEAMEHFSMALSIMKESTREEWQVDNHKDHAKVLEHKGNINFRQKKYSEALKNCEDALQSYEEKHITEGVLRVCGNIALVYGRINQLQKAIDYFQKQITIIKSRLGEDPKLLAGALHNLGRIYYKMGGSCYSKAIECYKEELTIRDANLNANDPKSRATVSRRLAFIHADTGAYTDALKYYSKAIDISISAALNEPDSESAETIVDGPAAISDKWTRYEEALVVKKNKLQQSNRDSINENKYFGFPSSNFVADMLNDMGNTFMLIGAHKKALLCYECSRRIREISPSNDDSEEVVRTKINIGVALFKTDSYDTALSTFDDILNVPQKAEDFPMAMILNYMGKTHFKLGSFTEALGFFQRTLSLKVASECSKNDKTHLGAMFNVGLAYYKSCEYAEAVQCFKDVLEIQKKLFDDNHHEFAGSLSMIASSYGKMKQYAEAMDYYKEALTARKKAFGVEHPKVLTILHNIGSIRYKRKEYDKAQSIFELIVQAKKNSLGVKHPSYGKALFDVAVVLFASEQYGLAQTLYEQVAAIFKISKLSEDHPYVQEAKKLEKSLREASSCDRRERSSSFSSIRSDLSRQTALLR